MNADNDSSAGRLDLLLQDPDAPRQHEAEILLVNPALSERSGTSPKHAVDCRFHAMLVSTVLGLVLTSTRTCRSRLVFPGECSLGCGSL